MRYEYLPWLVAFAAAIPFTANDLNSYPHLQFASDGKFSITVFSDLHLGESRTHDKSPVQPCLTFSAGTGKGPEADRKTIGVMNSILDIGKPNMVVLNGDLITCDNVVKENVIPLIDQITAPLVDRSIPFAATFGNHDMSRNCSTREMSEHMWNIQGKNGQRLSWTTSSVPGPANEVGTSNYFVPVYSSDGSKLALMLYFFDSKGGPEFDTGDNVPKVVDDKVSLGCAGANTSSHAKVAIY